MFIRVLMGVFAGAVIAASPAFAETAQGPAHVEVRVSGVKPVGAVRLMVYSTEETFLLEPIAKLQAPIDEDGVAVFQIPGLEAGRYSFAAYHDENGDGVLNRNAIGLPREAFAFSNGVRPKLRRPSFKRTAVNVTGHASVTFSFGGD